MTAKNAGSARVTRKSIDKYNIINVEYYVSIKVKAMHVGATYSVFLLHRITMLHSGQKCVYKCKEYNGAKTKCK